MKDGHIFAEHYGAIVVTSYTLLMAMVIFFMAMPLSAQITLLIISTVGFVVMMRPTPQDQPMGAAVEVEGVARPRPGLDSHGRRAA
jgi:hypothetical protein